MCVCVCVTVPVTSRSCVPRLTLVTQQLPFFTQMAGRAETIVVAMETLLLLIHSVMLSQCGEREEDEEEEERTESS